VALIAQLPGMPTSDDPLPRDIGYFTARIDLAR
jgi:hypothetical protein